MIISSNGNNLLSCGVLINTDFLGEEIIKTARKKICKYLYSQKTTQESYYIIEEPCYLENHEDHKGFYNHSQPRELLLPKTNHFCDEFPLSVMIKVHGLYISYK